MCPRPNRSKANVKDISIFQDLLSATENVRSNCEPLLGQPRDFIFEVDNQLEKIMDLLQQRLHEAEVKRENCDRDLSLCEASVSYDENGEPQPPNCSYERRKANQARRQVKAAENCVSQMKELMRMAEKIKNEYLQEEQSFKQLIDHDLADDCAYLRDEYDRMLEYLSSNLH
jgi:hypothetical protein